jgi:hypothetical protein
MPYQFTNIDFFGSSFRDSNLLWSIDGFEIDVHYVGRKKSNALFIEEECKLLTQVMC